MKIILIQPCYPLSFTVVPPLGLGYLASSLRDAGHEVQIVDCIAKNINVKTIQELVKKEQPQLIGVTILTIYFKEARELISKIKECSSAYIIIGGHHVTALPIESLEKTGADFAVVGEGEETIVELANKIVTNQAYSDVKGICYKSVKGRIIVNSPRSLIDNLDNIPFPAWDLFGLRSYPYVPHGIFNRRFPSVGIITSRGCPFDCTFCAVKLTFGKKLRTRSAKNVVDEIELLSSKFGVKEFHFEDDNFNASKVHAMGISQEIIDRKLDISWSCPNGVRIDLLDEELLRKMRESGCYKLSVGIESFSQSILNRAKKHLDINLVPDQIRLIKKAGLEVEGFFILGLPGESEETICNTIKFALDLPLDFARFHLPIPLPGTEIYDEWFKGKIDPIDFSKATVLGGNPFKKDGLDFPYLINCQKKAHRRFYLRPKTLIKILSRVKRKQFIWLIKRGLRLF